MPLGIPNDNQRSTKWLPELMQALTPLTVEIDGINFLISALDTAPFTL